MKFVFIILGLVAALGLAWTLAFFGVIPAQKIADKNASARSILKALHLAKDRPKPKVDVAQAATAPADDPAQKLAAEQAKLDSDRAAFEQERAAFDRQKTASASGPQAGDGSTTAAPAPDRGKLISIYSTMKPDDIAEILAHVPDRSALADIAAMDEKRAGKVLAAMPPDRAAKLSELMASQPPPAAATPAQAASL